jgi:LmbE family N-acetylglucosaminyl deacetylase
MPSTRSRIVARATDRLPLAVERALLRARSLASDRPTIGLPPARRALVLAPHPDDETLACGGTMALLARRSCDVRVLVVTDGDAAKVALATDEVRRRRRAEVTAACAALGVAPPVLLGFPDGRIGARVGAVAAEIAAHLADHAPDLVLLPWFGDGHPDHRAVNDALATAAARHGGPAPLVLGGETWTPAPVTRVVEVTDVEAQLRRAVAAHATAACSFDLEAMLALKRYRSIHGLRGRGLAEAFLALPLPRYAELVRHDGRGA